MINNLPLLLYIESSSTVCSVAISQGDKLIAIKETNEGYSHAENLTWFIEQICIENAINLQSIDAVVVSKGPGSYTGLRIGVSAAKGICFALDKPLIAINTLQSMASYAASKYKTENALYFPMQDARRMEVYNAAYDVNNKEIIETRALIVDENTTATIEWNGTIYYFGDGAEKCKNHFNGDARFVLLDDILPSSNNLIKLANKAFSENKFENLIYFEPYYLKEFVAGKKGE